MGFLSRARRALKREAPASDSAIAMGQQAREQHGGSFSSDESLVKSAPNKGSNQKGLRIRGIGLAGWKHLSTRLKIVIVGAIISVVALAIGLSVGLTEANKHSKEKPTAKWKPAIGNTWQIQLNGPLTSITMAAHNYDIDLFENNEKTIKTLHYMNAKVICYFSAGSYEEWRPDAKTFDNSSIGSNMAGWAGERWLDIRSGSVRSVMSSRIKLAAEKGCDGIDPDNIDGYSHNNTGFQLTKKDAVHYVQFLAEEAHSQGLAIGLKNGAELALLVMDFVEWDINESCAFYNECNTYHPFISAGRPVFHIEYVDGDNPVNLTTACNATGTRGFSTLLKHRNLDNWFQACPLIIV